MGPIWGRQDPGGPHAGPMNLAIWVENPHDNVREWPTVLTLICIVVLLVFCYIFLPLLLLLTIAYYYLHYSCHFIVIVSLHTYAFQDHNYHSYSFTNTTVLKIGHVCKADGSIHISIFPNVLMSLFLGGCTILFCQLLYIYIRKFRFSFVLSLCSPWCGKLLKYI